MNLIVKWLNILDVGSGKVVKLPVQKVHTGQRHIISSEKDLSKSEKLCMVEASWILTLRTQLQELVAVYFNILENSVIYHHIVTTTKLSKEYQ